MDVAEFLRARLAERVERAKTGALIYTVDRKTLETLAVTHEYRHDVLRDVEAKRRIIALWERSDFCERVALDDVLDLLALPYAEHPDYQQEWAPENWEEGQTAPTSSPVAPRP